MTDINRSDKDISVLIKTEQCRIRYPAITQILCCIQMLDVIFKIMKIIGKNLPRRRIRIILNNVILPFCKHIDQQFFMLDCWFYQFNVHMLSLK